GADALPPLNKAQRDKLRLLSIVTFAGEQGSLPYTELLEQLDVENVRELEDLIIGGIYQGILAGRLDQKKKCLDVEYGIGRDLRPGETAALLKSLTAWQVVAYGLSRLEHLSRDAAQYARDREEFDKLLETAKVSAKSAAAATGAGGAGGPGSSPADLDAFGEGLDRAGSR
ncbi:COP9 signalosome complex subunit 7a, partial [Cladochytrium tenue]